MKKIYSDEEFAEFYHYQGGPKKFPKTYPCFVKKESVDGGLMGDYVAHYVCYMPKSSTIAKAFEEGLNAKWERIG